jgi:hypothetical protein
MKRPVLVAVLVAALAGGSASAHAQAKPRQSKGTTSQGDGHTTPNQQPETAPAPTAPAGEQPLGSVNLAKAVKADGMVLAAGTYQVRLTAQAASPDAKGETQGLERWVEFLQQGKVKGREVVTIVPKSEIKSIQKDAPPAPNSSKVQLLKGGQYVRVWINKGGNHYLVHLPTA